MAHLIWLYLQPTLDEKDYAAESLAWIQDYGLLGKAFLGLHVYCRSGLDLNSYLSPLD